MTKDKYIEFANKTLERWVAEDGYIYYKANLQGLEALCKLAAAQDKLLDDDDTLTIAYQSGYYDGKKAAQPAQPAPEQPAPEQQEPHALQGLAAYLRCEAGGVFVGSPNHDTLLQWAREVDAAKAQPAQEPVAHCEVGPEFCPVCRAETRSLALAAAVGYIQRNTPPLVSDEICMALATPPQRPWVGLTDEEVLQIREKLQVVEGISLLENLTKAIEAKLKEKNT